jgi:hypothetical protein
MLSLPLTLVVPPALSVRINPLAGVALAAFLAFAEMSVGHHLVWIKLRKRERQVALEALFHADSVSEVHEDN